MGDVGNGDAVLRGLHCIDVHVQDGLRIFDVPIRVHHTRSVLKDRLDLLSDLRLPVEIGTVNFGDQRLNHRRPGGNFAHLDARAILIADRVPASGRSRLAIAWLWSCADVCRQQVDLDVGLVRHAAHVVVAHQTVEVVWTGGSGVELVVQNIGLLRKFTVQAPGRRPASAPAACRQAY